MANIIILHGDGSEEEFDGTLEELVQRANPIGTCVNCGKEVNPYLDFRDRISKQEWRITHLCQECQDLVFGEGE